jgi:hypothetical protein
MYDVLRLRMLQENFRKGGPTAQGLARDCSAFNPPAKTSCAYSPAYTTGRHLILHRFDFLQVLIKLTIA